MSRPKKRKLHRVVAIDFRLDLQRLRAQWDREDHGATLDLERETEESLRRHPERQEWIRAEWGGWHARASYPREL